MNGDSDLGSRVSHLLATIDPDQAKTALRDPRSTIEPLRPGSESARSRWCRG